MRFSAKMPYHQLYRAGDGFDIKIGYVRERTSAHTHRSLNSLYSRSVAFSRAEKKLAFGNGIVYNKYAI